MTENNVDTLSRKVARLNHRIKETARVLVRADRTIHQKINYLKFKFMVIRRQVNVSNYPIKLTIDPCNACNLRCTFCPTGKREEGRHMTKMKFETFEKLINETGKYLWEIDFFNWGEPLLNKEIFRMIEHAKSYKIDTNVSTNLNFCTEETAEKLVRCGLDKMIVSLDGASQESVEKYQIENDFELVIKHLRRVVKWKKKLNSKLPFIQWRYLVNKHNEHEIDKAKEMAEEIGVDHLEIARFRCSMGDEIFMNSEQQYEDVKEWLPENMDLSLYKYDEKRKKRVKTFCDRPWWEAVVHPDGNVSPCCSVWNEKFDFGNVRESTFQEIWNGEKYHQSRTLFYKDGSEFPGHICDTCKKNGAID